MPLVAAGLDIVLGWKLKLPVPGYADRVQGPDQQSFHLTVDLDETDQVLSEIVDVPVGGGVGLNLSSFMNPNGEDTGLTRVVAVMIEVTGEPVVARGGGTDGIGWWLVDGELIQAGGVRVFAEPAEVVPGQSMIWFDYAGGGTEPTADHHATVKVTIIGGTG